MSGGWRAAARAAALEIRRRRRRHSPAPLSLPLSIPAGWARRTSTSPTGTRPTRASTRCSCTRTCCAASTRTVRPQADQPLQPLCLQPHASKRACRQCRPSGPGMVACSSGTPCPRLVLPACDPSPVAAGADAARFPRPAPRPPPGFEKPSAIQQKGIVPFGKGLDVIQQAQSGTGKTATFCAGILQVGAGWHRLVGAGAAAAAAFGPALLLPLKRDGGGSQRKRRQCGRRQRGAAAAVERDVTEHASMAAGVDPRRQSGSGGGSGSMPHVAAAQLERETGAGELAAAGGWGEDSRRLAALQRHC